MLPTTPERYSLSLYQRTLFVHPLKWSPTCRAGTAAAGHHRFMEGGGP